MGITPDEVRFSWQMESDKRGNAQGARQIVVASTKEQLLNKQYLWNSDKVAGRNNMLIPYSGPALQPAHRYYWRVRVWDKFGKSSGWSRTGAFVTGLWKDSDWHDAKWIGYETLPDSMKIVPGVPRPDKSLGDLGKRRPVIPLFRNDFTLRKQIAGALLFISGLGQYDASINGKKVGNGFLTPGWTYYPKTVLYNTYDITEDLKEGKNAIGVIVGNGFYNINRERYRKLDVAFGMPEMIALLKITFTDGTVQTITTGSNWKTDQSPVTFTSIYGGEDYDARLEQEGWNQAGFDDSAWRNALEVEPPGGKLVPETEYPVRVMKVLDPQKILHPYKKTYIYDFGQNASGTIELKVKGRRGQKIKLIPGELLNDKELVDQKASGRPYYYTYTLKGDSVETWRPEFTYYGFRYVQIKGADPDTVAESKDRPQIVALKFLHTRNSAPIAGSFECSDTLFNRIYSLIDWAIKSNIQSVVTDCPHREKLGWLEQDYLMGGSIHYNYDIYHLYRRMVYDMMDSQTKNGLVPDIAPEFVKFKDGYRDSPEWGSASVILPWFIYRWYGDKNVMKKAWPMMRRYVDYLGSKTHNHILSYGLGDWFDLGPKPPGKSQLTPEGVTATAIYYYDLDLLSKMSNLLGYRHETSRLSARAALVKKAFNDTFFDSSTNVYATGSQTAMAMPLVVGLVPKDRKQQVLSNLKTSIKKNNNRLTAGDIGFHFLIQALENGDASQLIYEMNNHSDVPGYGYQLKQGATSLTESWAALRNLSNNHLMLGDLMEWFYSGIAGIRQSKKSNAYRDIIIAPDFVGTITSSKARYETPNGPVLSDWKIKDHVVRLTIRIPFNSSAEIKLPIPTTVIKTLSESGKSIYDTPSISVKEIHNDTTSLTVGSGTYHFRFNISD